jgi:hypothetical protein
MRHNLLCQYALLPQHIVLPLQLQIPLAHASALQHLRTLHARLSQISTALLRAQQHTEVVDMWVVAGC